MSPIKILIISILLYLGYKLVTGDGKKEETDKEDACIEEEQIDTSVTDVLVEDPICHKLVPKQEAICLKLELKQKNIYFCSEECCKQFVSQEGDKE